jgi:gamma-glutamylcyclotransferase (GGCT)/AIG2-like uncharacterized protein YtfP
VAADLIAFYGTLMAGLGGQERLGVADRLELVAPCVLSGTLVEIGWYPGLAAEPQGRVVGELYRLLDPHVLGVLDRYEGADPADPDGSEYRRVLTTTLEPGAQAWVYLLNRPRPDQPRIASGDWRLHARDRGLAR